MSDQSGPSFWARLETHGDCDEKRKSRVVVSLRVFPDNVQHVLETARHRKASSQDFADHGGHPWVPAELTLPHPAPFPRNFFSLVARNGLLW